MIVERKQAAGHLTKPAIRTFDIWRQRVCIVLRAGVVRAGTCVVVLMDIKSHLRENALSFVSTFETRKYSHLEGTKSFALRIGMCTV